GRTDGDRDWRIGGLRAVDDGSTSDHLRTENLPARNLLAGAEHVVGGSTHVADSKHAVGDEHVELTNAGLAFEVLVHIPKAGNCEFARAVNHGGVRRETVAFACGVGGYDLAIGDDKSDVALNCAVYNIDDVDVSDDQRRLRRERQRGQN